MYPTKYAIPETIANNVTMNKTVTVTSFIFQGI